MKPRIKKVIAKNLRFVLLEINEADAKKIDAKIAQTGATFTGFVRACVAKELKPK